LWKSGQAIGRVLRLDDRPNAADLNSADVAYAPHVLKWSVNEELK
jgi:hypothetical protein